MANLEIFERKTLRKIFGVNKISENDYKRKSNKLYQLFEDTDVELHIRISRLKRWLGHANRMEKQNEGGRCLVTYIALDQEEDQETSGSAQSWRT